jgi:RNA polymerase sigma-70 factor (ECF subfamily)
VERAACQSSQGRFRSFLIAALRHFLVNHIRRERRIKRGGQQHRVDLDALSPGQADALAITDEAQPDECEKEERDGALALMSRALCRLAESYEAAGQSVLFEQLQSFFSCDNRTSYNTISRTLGRPIGTLRNDVRRMRAPFRQCVRDEVPATVERDAVDGEIWRLIALLCPGS